MGMFNVFSSNKSASRMSGLSITTEAHHNEIKVKLNGRLDASQVNKLTSTLNALNQNICLDLNDLHFVDVRGLSALFAQKQKLIQNQRQLSITNVQDSVRLIFEITRLDEVLLSHEGQQPAFNFAGFLHSNDNFILA